MSVKTISRLVGALVALAIVGVLYFLDHTTFASLWWLAGIAGGAALIAFIISPYVTVVPYRWMRESSVGDLVAAVVGLIVGLIISLLLFTVLSSLPFNLGKIMPFVAMVVLSFLGVPCTKIFFPHQFGRGNKVIVGAPGDRQGVSGASPLR